MYFRSNPELALKQRVTLTVLRFAVFFLLCLFLLTPMIYYIKRYIDKPTVILLKDNSQSMSIDHRGKTKTEAMETSYSSMSKTFKQSGYSVKELEFADGLKGNKNSTFLLSTLEALRASLKKTSINSIFIFSDGWFRDIDLNVLKAYDIPVNTIADTTRNLNADLQIIELRHNRQGYRNELSVFEAGIKSTGFGKSAQVQFMVDDKLLKQKTVSFEKELVQTVTFENRFSKLGMHKLEVRIQSDKLNEQTLSNNNYSSAIDILNDKDKILLLTDAPNWDNKFILDAISENNRWQTQSITIEGQELYQGGQKTTLNNLDNVSVIIILNQGTIQLDSKLAQIILNKVNQGCGLLSCGFPVPQLTDILPLRQSNIRSTYQGIFKLLPVSAAYSVFQIPVDELNLIPPIDYYYVTPSASAEILAVMDNSQKSPAIAINNLSRGKVVSFSFLNLWRWQLQSKSFAYKNFVTDLIVWLGNKGAGQMTAIYQPSYLLGEEIEIKLSASDEIHKLKSGLTPRINVFNAKNDSIYSDFMLLDNSNNYNIRFRINKPDNYHFRIIDQSIAQSVQGSFVLQQQNQESRDLGYNISLLSWIASQTGGKFMNIAEAKDIKPLKAVMSKRTEKSEFPLYKKWYLISLFVIVFCFELFLRRRWGLL